MLSDLPFRELVNSASMSPEAQLLRTVCTGEGVLTGCLSPSKLGPHQRHPPTLVSLALSLCVPVGRLVYGGLLGPSFPFAHSKGVKQQPRGAIDVTGIVGSEMASVSV